MNSIHGIRVFVFFGFFKKTKKTDLFGFFVNNIGFLFSI